MFALLNISLLWKIVAMEESRADSFDFSEEPSCNVVFEINMSTIFDNQNTIQLQFV